MAETSIPASPSKDEQRAGRARKGARHSKEQTALALKEEKVTGKKRQKQQGQQQGSGFTVKPSSSAAWPFVRLSDSQGSKSTNSLPPIYSKDGRLCFIASGRSVKIHDAATSQLVSTLAPLSSSTGSDQVTGIFINSTNALQLIVTSLDGNIRIWDFLDAKVLRTIEMGHPIHLAAMSTAPHLEDQLFVGVKPAAGENAAEEVEGESVKGSGRKFASTTIYQVSLKRLVNKRFKLGTCRNPRSMSLSANGEHLVLVSKRMVHVAAVAKDFSAATAKEGFVSFQGFPDHISDRITALACHPTESYFATGDSKGSISLWYILDSSILSNLSSGKPQVGGDLMRKHTSTLHWHAHAVASLAFTPNGAYLLSGGEEAVLVAWQLASRHKEFVPRLGAPIQSIGIVQGQGKEQEFACRLADGSTVFVGAGTLKIVRNIAGVKSIPAPNMSKSYRTSYPLAIEPRSQHLVFLASHPSALQFFSPALNTHVYELEVSPTNRVSRKDDRPIEPTRVEKVAFSSPASGSSNTGDSRTWMATFDTWQDRDYRRENHLKFWLKKQNSADMGYSLNTRIDNPHGQSPISAMAFTSSDSVMPRLATASASVSGGLASEGGIIKLWQHNSFSAVATSLPNGAWQCVRSFNHRNLRVRDLAFSADGSLLAVAHEAATGVGAVVTLWDASSGALIRVLNAGGRVGTKVGKITFVEGREGARMVLAGELGSIVWDVLTCEELLSLPLPTEQVVATTSSARDNYIATHTSTAYEVDLLTSQLSAHTLAFDPTQMVPYGPSSSNTFAAVSKKGEVLLTGSTERDLAVFGFSSAAATSGVSLRAVDESLTSDGSKGTRLFDELFGASSNEGSEYPQSTSQPMAYVRKQGKAASDIFDMTPSHVLPSVQSLWKDLLQPGLRPLLASSQKQKRRRGQNGLQDDEEEEEDEEDDAGAGESGMDVDPSTTTKIDNDAQLYIDSPATLSEIFKSSLLISATSAEKMSNGEETPAKAAGQKERKSSSKKANK